MGNYTDNTMALNPEWFLVIGTITGWGGKALHAFYKRDKTEGEFRAEFKAEVKGKIELLEAKLTAQDTQISRIETRVDNLGDDMEKQIDNLGEKMETALIGIGQLAAKIERMNGGHK